MSLVSSSGQSTTRQHSPGESAGFPRCRRAAKSDIVVQVEAVLQFHGAFISLLCIASVCEAETYIPVGQVGFLNQGVGSTSTHCVWLHIAHCQMLDSCFTEHELGAGRLHRTTVGGRLSRKLAPTNRRRGPARKGVWEPYAL